ncbi:MAG: c-type cytochrome [Verrucomicrobia bacterium]|nr:c-type cytochrome [Verrucomicrobiota bacterium]
MKRRQNVLHHARELAKFTRLKIKHVALCLTLSSLGAAAATLKIELPRELETFPTGAGAELANTHCLICHSADYVKIQPPLARAAWKASVLKMQQKYGAAIPEDQVDPLANYLVRTFGTEKNSPVANKSGETNTKSVPNATGSSAQVNDGVKLVAKLGCVGCHTVEKKIVGPAFKDVAAKYAGRDDAQEKVSHQITHGGGGAWGTIPMPPFPQISAAEIATLANWILASNQPKTGR